MTTAVLAETLEEIKKKKRRASNPKHEMIHFKISSSSLSMADQVSHP
jgi:hypothetical protein